MKLRRMAIVLLAACGLGGCDLGRHWLAEAPCDQVVKAESGDRFYLTLAEDPVSGARWSAESNDRDVTVEVAHRPGKAKVEIRVHRGFDGPATVSFSCRQKSGDSPPGFSVVLYRRTGDVAFWE